MFPQAAAANRSIFYEASGQPRSAAQVYSRLTGRFEVARALTFAPGAGGGQGGAPDPAGTTQAIAAATAQRTVADTRPLFESIFTDRVGAAVSPAVSSLWAPTAASSTGGPATAPALDLFTDGKPNLRGMFGAS
jgi:hypothetical protein